MKYIRTKENKIIDVESVTYPYTVTRDESGEHINFNEHGCYTIVGKANHIEELFDYAAIEFYGCNAIKFEYLGNIKVLKLKKIKELINKEHYIHFEERRIKSFKLCFLTDKGLIYGYEIDLKKYKDKE